MAYDDVAFGRRAGQDDDGGRDRLGVHLGWEVVLALGAAALGFLLYRLDPASLRRPALDTLLLTATAIGLLTLGAGLTLRAGVPNLAVGPIALAASLHFAENGDRGLIKAAAPALVIAAGGAVVIGVLILALHVPGWVATLGAGMGVIVYDQLRTAPVGVQGGYDPSNQAFFLFGAFALMAVVGGAVGVLDPVRRRLGAMRQATDPARRRTQVALPVLGSLIVSSVFAVVAGILLAAQSARPIVPGTGLEWTGIALGTALVAGTSAYGRRGGVFGTLLAVVAMTLFLDYADRRGFNIALFATAACTIGGGLIVTRLVETYGRTLTVADAAPDWEPEAPADTATWRADLPETWTGAGVGAQRRGERWDEGPWGSGR
ncbi:ABC transporter permease [Krasilnikovia sp. M28-CT-15]|uniref:ABC transporter permease n=1 Tax=Krasilnikovia sp. M28-CT-15 TaxID=3373540 RepID=UPI0038775883